MAGPFPAVIITWCHLLWAYFPNPLEMGDRSSELFVFFGGVPDQQNQDKAKNLPDVQCFFWQ